MQTRKWLLTGLLSALIAGSAWGAPLFVDGFETYAVGGLDKNYGGPNAAPAGSGNPWFGPFPPNALVDTVLPHSGQKMIRGISPFYFGQNWVNIAYRFNNGNVFTGNIQLEFWFYDPLGPGGSSCADYAALGYYNTAPTNAEYPPSGDLSVGASQVQRLSIGMADVQGGGYNSNKYQVRVVGAVDGYASGWFNTDVDRSIGWHHAMIVVEPALPDNTNQVRFYIDDMVNPVLTHNSVRAWGYNVIEVNTSYGSTSAYFDDFTLDFLPPTGACCIDGACSLLTEAVCASGGGIYKGDGAACEARSCCNTPFADANGDLFVDMDDFGAFQTCYSGHLPTPTGPQFAYSCACFDTDETETVDADDFAAFMLCATGPAIPWAPSSGCP